MSLEEKSGVDALIAQLNRSLGRGLNEVDAETMWKVNQRIPITSLKKNDGNDVSLLDEPINT